MAEKKKGGAKGGSAARILGRSKGENNPRRSALGRGSSQVQPGFGDDAGVEESPRRRLQEGSEETKKRQPKKRITVDLPKDEHKFLRDFAYDNETDGMRVVRALLMELMDDPGLSEKVLRRLPQTR